MLLLIACLLIAGMKLGWGWYGITVLLYLTERILVAAWHDMLVNKVARLVFEAQLQSMTCQVCAKGESKDCTCSERNMDEDELCPCAACKKERGELN